MKMKHLYWFIGAAVLGYLAGNSMASAAQSGATSGIGLNLYTVPGILPAFQAGERAAGASV
jgi:hypothetical protein